MRLSTLAMLCLVTACAAGADARRDAWRAAVDTIGDTIVVRTVSGAEWGTFELVPELRIGELDSEEDAYLIGSITGLAVDGEGNIYAYDSQVPALRKYGPDGAYIATFGRRGGGPGEYANSDGGLIALPDGRVLLRDPGNARFTIYHPDGTLADEWLGRGGFFTSTPPYVDTAGNVYNIVIEEWPENRRPPNGDLWRFRMVRYDCAGQPRDTLDIPDYPYERAVLTMERAGRDGVSRMMNSVPFAPGFHWTMDPAGRFVAGTGHRYAVDVHMQDGRVLRMARDAEPVRISAAERANAEERATANMRRNDPSWRWNGPPIPDEKPAISGLFTGRDGRIWVRRPAPGEPIPDAEVDAPRDVGNGITIPPLRFREPVVFDVFEPDGRFLGSGQAPRGLSMHPLPVARGDFLWAVVQDDLGVSTIQRLRIVPGPKATGAS